MTLRTAIELLDLAERQLLAAEDAAQQTLRDERQRLGLTHAELAARAGGSPGATEHYESGRRRLTARRLRRIAEALGDAP